MAKGAKVYTVPFGASGMVAHPNRWLTKAGDLAIAQNVTFENDMLQKEPAAAHYDTTGIAIESPNGTFSASSDSTFAALWLPALSTAAFDAVQATAALSTTSPATLHFATNLAAGMLVVVVVGQRINKTDVPLMKKVTDVRGNVYVRQKQTGGSASIDSTVEIWTSIVTVPITAGDGISFIFTTATADDRAFIVASYTGVTSGTTEAVAAAAL